MKRDRNDERQQSGAAMVEMALVLPILLLLVLGIVDFGRALNYWNDTNQVAGQAARYAAVNTNPGGVNGAMTSDDAFFNWIRCQAETAELRGPDSGCPSGDDDWQAVEGAEPAPSASVPDTLKVCVELNPDVTDPRKVGEPITVRVTNDFSVLALIREAVRRSVDPGFGTLRLTGRATMRLEQRYTGPAGCDPDA